MFLHERKFLARDKSEDGRNPRVSCVLDWACRSPHGNSPKIVPGNWSCTYMSKVSYLWQYIFVSGCLVMSSSYVYLFISLATVRWTQSEAACFYIMLCFCMEQRLPNHKLCAVVSTQVCCEYLNIFVYTWTSISYDKFAAIILIVSYRETQWWNAWKPFVLRLQTLFSHIIFCMINFPISRTLLLDVHGNFAC